MPPQPLRRFFGLPTETTAPPPEEEPSPSSPAEAVDTTDAAMADAAEALRLRDLWTDQPSEVLEAWTNYNGATTADERHHHAASVIHGAARACKAHEPWARTPAVREAFARAGRSWDIHERRRRQGAGR